MAPRTASSVTTDAANNVARPVAGVVGLLAFAADAIILVALVGRLLLGGAVWTGSLILGLLVVVGGTRVRPAPSARPAAEEHST